MRAELELARGQIDAARDSIVRFRTTASIVGGVEVAPIHLAKYHLDEAAAKIASALGNDAPRPAEVAQISKSAVPQVSNLPSPESGISNLKSEIPS